MLPRIANFDDLDPLKAEPAVEVVMVPPGSSLPADAGLVVLPGTKSTIADLLALRENGWDRELVAHVKRGGMCLVFAAGFKCLDGGSVTRRVLKVMCAISRAGPSLYRDADGAGKSGSQC